LKNNIFENYDENKSREMKSTKRLYRKKFSGQEENELFLKIKFLISEDLMNRRSLVLS
jgi:hypothetical protein